MKVSFEKLGTELTSCGYQKVIFVEVECNVDGAYRLGLSPEQVIGERFECPRCHEQRPCSGVLAVGYSSRPLPLEEYWCGPGNWSFKAREEQPAQAA